LRHRGRDGSGALSLRGPAFLGSRRPAIIDHQPIANVGGSVVVVLAGRNESQGVRRTSDKSDPIKLNQTKSNLILAFHQLVGRAATFKVACVPDSNGVGILASEARAEACGYNYAAGKQSCAEF
jgi:hypothetical protein